MCSWVSRDQMRTTHTTARRACVSSTISQSCTTCKYRRGSTPARAPAVSVRQLVLSPRGRMQVPRRLGHRQRRPIPKSLRLSRERYHSPQMAFPTTRSPRASLPPRPQSPFHRHNHPPCNFDIHSARKSCWRPWNTSKMWRPSLGSQ